MRECLIQAYRPIHDAQKDILIVPHQVNTILAQTK